MSLFFDYNIGLREESPALVTWSNSEFQPMLTVATTSGKILLFTEEGEPLPPPAMSRNATPCQLLWHSYLPTLFVCWGDGVISHWSEGDSSAKEEKAIHGCNICGIALSPDGTRMVTGDEHGVVGVWNSSRSLAPICQYHKEGAITNLAYCGIAAEAGEVPTIDQMNRFFFFAGTSGSVHLADDQKRSSEVCKVGGQVKSLLYYREDNSIVIVTTSLLLVQFRVSPNEKLVPTRKVKLTVAGDPSMLNTVWGGPGLLVTVSGENMLRLWNLEHDKHYFLTLADADITGKLLSDRVTCIAYHEKKKLLAGGTQEGRVIMWKSKFLLSGEAPASNEGWEPQLPVSLSKTPITAITWGTGEAILGASSARELSVLTEAMLKKRVKLGVVALQVFNNMVEVRKMNKLDTPLQINSKIRIKGMDISSSIVTIWNGKTIESYSHDEGKGGEIMGKFQKSSFIIACHKENVIVCTEGTIEVCNVNGVIKQTFNVSEGEVTSIDVLGDHMVITTDSHLRLFDLSKKEYVQRGMPRKFEDKQGQSLGLIRQGFISSGGNKVGLLVDQAPKQTLIFPDTNIFIYDADLDQFVYYDFGPNQIPMDMSWDPSEPRLCVVETEGLSLSLDEEVTEDQFNEAVTLFVSSDYGVFKQDSVRLDTERCGVLGVYVPYLFFVGKEVGEDNLSGIGKILRRPLRDFTGLENCDDSVRQAVLDFSFYLTVGNMDESFKAVKAIQNVSVWENMCTMSIKTKRLDVAEVCLGNMRFARGAKAVREARIEPEKEAQLAMAAIQLNMLEDAKSLYTEGKRYDLLNSMLQASGDWEGAVQVAEAHDRINLKSTYYQMARHYESLQDFSTAVEYYEMADAHREEVPRMLHQNNRIQELERYITNKEEPVLLKWWAYHLESQGDMKGALGYYNRAKDFGSVVRVLLSLGAIDHAQTICRDQNTKLGNLYLAKHLEEQGEIREAIQLYSKAQRYHNAVRLAKEHKMDGDLMALALRSGNSTLMLQAGQYFEQKHLLDRAVVLYHKGKNIKKALEICFNNQNYSYLKTLVDDLGEEEDPTTLIKAAEYLIQQNMYDKAVHLLVSAKKYSQALELCLNYNVAVDEAIVEKMLPADFSDSNSKDMLRRIAKLCKRQGAFQLACKLYTKLGEKLKGFKCLLRLGDVDKVKQYANTAKNPQIYVMAANFMQNADWHTNADYMKTIIVFYTKAKSWDSLASFFDACASFEIDEYRDYDKALVALKEALKYQSKSSNPNKEDLIRQHQRRMALLEQFVEARKMVNSNPHEMVRICQQLLETREIDQAIRVGDVYAQLVEFYYSQRDFNQAYQLMSKMRQKGIILNPYLDQEIIDVIHQHMGMGSNDEEEFID